MSKTIKQWLEELPDGYRERALSYYNEASEQITTESVCDHVYKAVCWGFDWRETNEGNAFWLDVSISLTGNSALPPLPAVENSPGKDEVTDG